MATNPEERPRSLEVQRAQAEERRQRLEEQWYELEVKNSQREDRKHKLEKTKINIDVLKHFVTIVTALLFILAYFGETIIPFMRSYPIPFTGIAAWPVAVVGLGTSLGFSLISLVFSAFLPDDEFFDWGIAFGLVVSLLVLGFTVVIVVTSMAMVGLSS